jgi:CrcB protein
MIKLVLVGLGGGLGAMARYLTGIGYQRMFGLARPWLATAFINVAGGLLMGLLVGVLALRVSEGGDRWRLLLGVGVLGGFTTFSTFSLEAVMMLERRDYITFLGYIAGSVALSILALMVGLAFARRAFV